MTSNSLNYALLQNAAGNYPKAEHSGDQRGGCDGEVGSPWRCLDRRSPGLGQERMADSTFTYVIVPTSTDKADALKKFITYALGPGQSFAEGLGYGTLPKQVVTDSKAALGKIGG